jgi:hypothetical protein
VLRLLDDPRHGTDHDSKPLLSSSGIRLRPRPFQSRQEVHRGDGAATPGRQGGVLGV